MYTDLVELSGFEFNGAPNFKLGGSLITDNEEPLVNWGTLSTFVTPVLNVGETAFDSLGEANFSPKLNIGELLDLLAALSEVKVDRVAISAGCAVILGEGMVENANTGPFPAATASSLFSLMSDWAGDLSTVMDSETVVLLSKEEVGLSLPFPSAEGIEGGPLESSSSSSR